MSQNESVVYHLVAYEFAGKDRASDVVSLVKKAGHAEDFKVKAWAVMEVNDKGKAAIHQSGHGGIGTAAGLGVGALLGLVGGPAGLLIWAVGGALIGGIAGKYMGHQFDSAQLKALTADMEPNSSAIIVIIEDKAAEAMAKEMSPYGAKVVTVTLGSQLSGEVESFAAVDLGEDSETPAAEAAAPAAAAPAAEAPKA
jgi:uncharacterized membrane protein